MTAALNNSTTAAGHAGAAGRSAGEQTKAGAEAAAAGWAAVSQTLADYATKVREIGGDIGNALVGAFRSPESTTAEFVKIGKLKFGDLVTSLIAVWRSSRPGVSSLARSRACFLAFWAISVAGSSPNILHAGGMVGSPGPGRMVPAFAFTNAPRMHSGGWAGLRPDEVPGSCNVVSGCSRGERQRVPEPSDRLHSAAFGEHGRIDR